MNAKLYDNFMKTIHIHAQFDALECSVQCRSVLSSFFCITVYKKRLLFNILYYILIVAKKV